MPHLPETPPLPTSRARWSDPFLILGLIIVGSAALSRTSLAMEYVVMLLVALVTLVMALPEISAAPWRTKKPPHITWKLTLQRSFVKGLGISFGAALVVSGWLLIEEYREPFFEPLLKVLSILGLILVPLCLIIVPVTERLTGPQKDPYWQCGLFVLGRWKSINWSKLREGLLGWLIKGFFLPLNFCAAVAYGQEMRDSFSLLASGSWPEIEKWGETAIWFCLCVSIIPGYVFGSRLLGTELKKVEQSWFGWAVTLLCYPPVNHGTGDGWFAYSKEILNFSGLPHWVVVLGADTRSGHTAALFLLLFTFIHYWGESICCLRSSHLSNRGIITNGPFRWCKHPVYTIKLCAWSLAALPFCGAATLAGNVRSCIAFLALACVYVMRAWVEERLLSSDPDYVAYGLWMDRHSLFRPLGRWLPFVNYGWRLNHWRTKNIIP